MVEERGREKRERVRERGGGGSANIHTKFAALAATAYATSSTCTLHTREIALRYSLARANTAPEGASDIAQRPERIYVAPRRQSLCALLRQSL